MITLVRRGDVWVMRVRFLFITLYYTAQVKEKSAISQGHLFIGPCHLWGICTHVEGGKVWVHPR